MPWYFFYLSNDVVAAGKYPAFGKLKEMQLQFVCLSSSWVRHINMSTFIMIIDWFLRQIPCWFKKVGNQIKMVALLYNFQTELSDNSTYDVFFKD